MCGSGFQPHLKPVNPLRAAVCRQPKASPFGRPSGIRRASDFRLARQIENSPQPMPFFPRFDPKRTHLLDQVESFIKIER